MAKRAADPNSEVPPAKRAAPAPFTLRVAFDGADAAVKLAGGGPPTLSKVREAAAEAAGLPAVLLRVRPAGGGGSELDEAGASALADGGQVEASVREDASLALLALKAERAAKAAGREEEFVLQSPLDDEGGSLVDDFIENWGFDRRIPAEIKLLMRVAGGVKTDGSVLHCGSAIPSAKDMEELIEYNDTLGEALVNEKNCFPWRSVDCEFAFEVLEVSTLTLWQFDHENRQAYCLGTIKEQLEAIVRHYEGKQPGEDLPVLKLESKSGKPCLRLSYGDVYGADDNERWDEDEDEDEDED